MTFEYIMRKSLSRPAHCYSAHVPGKGYVNRGDDPSTRADYDRQRVQTALSEIDNVTWAPGYAEKGYDDPKRGVLFANWNYFARGLDSILERAGYAIEWSDEWATCADCNRAVRTSGDSYFWQPSYIWQNDCEIVCHDCADWASYLETIEDDPNKACMASIDPSVYGYVLISERNEFETGFHPGQTDDPSKVLAALRAKGHDRIVFRLSETSQFYSRWEVYKRIVEDEDEDE